MGLQEQVAKDLIEAMKAKDAVKTGVLRMLKSAFGVKEIERKKALTEGEALEVAQAEAKRRREAADEFKKANRTDLSQKEEAELAVLTTYLPAQLSAEDLQKLVDAAVQSVGAKGPQDMGRVMSALMPQIKGRADGKQAQQLVQKKLS